MAKEVLPPIEEEPLPGDRSVLTLSAGTEITAAAEAHGFHLITTGVLPKAGIMDILHRETIYTEGAAGLPQGHLQTEVTVLPELPGRPVTQDHPASGVHAAVAPTEVLEVQEAEAPAVSGVQAAAVEVPVVSGVPAAVAEVQEA